MTTTILLPLRAALLRFPAVALWAALTGAAAAADPPPATDSAAKKEADAKKEPEWRAVPLIKDGKVSPDFVHIGWGSFTVDEGTIRTEPDPKGLGLLVYQKETLGNCQIRVVYRSKDTKSNSGVYVRVADGILKQVKQPGAAFERGADGKPTKETMEKMQASAKRDEGPWYAVHHGYEVQVADGGGAMHGTGSIYSLAPSSFKPAKEGEWRTMVITLNKKVISVEIDGQQVSSLDTASKSLPERKIWHEPKREPERPESGYLGLQTHDPGDVVWYREVSVRPLPATAAAAAPK